MTLASTRRKGGVVTDTSTRAVLDPAVAKALASQPIDVGGLFGGLSDATLAGVRAAIEQMSVPELSEKVLRTDHEVPGSGGVIVRVHRPIDLVGTLPCLFWAHGGGFVLGGRADDDARFDRWCPLFGCVGVSVEYRLGPQTQYPGPIDDCYAGLSWVCERAADLGVDAARLGIGGASAGGGLAAGLALLARDRGEIPLAFQLLIAPMIDDRQITASSHWEDPIWPAPANTYGWTAYLGDRKGGDDVEVYAAPARATDLAGMPPTMISVGAIDSLSDESVDYAERLRHAGVPVDLLVYAGCPHAFARFAPGSDVARRANRDVEDWLAAQLS